MLVCPMAFWKARLDVLSVSARSFPRNSRSITLANADIADRFLGLPRAEIFVAGEWPAEVVPDYAKKSWSLSKNIDTHQDDTGNGPLFGVGTS